MIYTEVLPFVWLGIAFGLPLICALSVTINGFSPAAAAAVDDSASVTVPFVDSVYCPTTISFLFPFLHAALFSQWWFWAPYVYLVGRISHAIARGKDCFALQQHTNLTGKVAIVTGANSGIGYYTALQLAEMGATVVLACRSEAKAQATAKEICEEIVMKRGGKKVGGAGITNIPPPQTSIAAGGGGTSSSSAIPAAASSSSSSSATAANATTPTFISQHGHEIKLRTDFSIEMDDFVSVKRFAQRFLSEGLPLHFLVNNAGMMVTDVQFSKFNPSLELHSAVNFFGPLLLTELLWERLCKTTLELSTAAITTAPSPNGATNNNSKKNVSRTKKATAIDAQRAQLRDEEQNIFTMTRSRVIFVSSEVHGIPTVDKAFKWFDKKLRQPIASTPATSSSDSSLSSRSAVLEALRGANGFSGGGENNNNKPTGLIIRPTNVNSSVSGFVRYGYSKLCDIYCAHYFANKSAPTNVVNALLKSDLVDRKGGNGGGGTPQSTPSGSPNTALSSANPLSSPAESLKGAAGSLTSHSSSDYATPTAAAMNKIHPALRTTPLVVTLHPGLINSAFANNILSIYRYLTFITLTFQKTPLQGSQTNVFACIGNEADIMPHPRESNPHWDASYTAAPSNTATATRKEGGENDVNHATNPSSSSASAPQPQQRYTLAARYLAECSDYSFSEMKPIAWSLEDARDVVEWARTDVLKL